MSPGQPLASSIPASGQRLFSRSAACSGITAYHVRPRRPQGVLGAFDISKAMDITLNVNGQEERLTVDPQTILLYVLRNDLSLNGPKYGCGLGECGACAVLIGDDAVRSCVVPISAAVGRTITTLEGLGTPTKPHPVQAAFIQHQAAQCGYCLNGMIIAIVALLRRIPCPEEESIRDALRHHLCRCGTHMEILASARAVAGIAPADRSRLPGKPL